MDRTEFSELAGRHRHELLVHCYRMLGSFTEAEDAVQEVMLRAWRSRESYAGLASFKAWLYRIATNVCLDLLRVRGREVAVTEDVLGGGARAATAEVTWLEPIPDRVLDAAEGSPEAAVIARETIELAFLAAIQHLPVKQRAVLILRDVLGWPAEETAGALEMSVAAVKSALQRARETMRGNLPADRGEWGPVGEPDKGDREILRRYVEASQRADVGELAALLREDARQAMPPANLLFAGRAAIIAMWERALVGADAWGEWRTVEIGANRQPAVANYVRRPGEDRFSAVNIDVLRLADGLIVEITTFGPELLPAFGLEPSL
ncbi:RNA polymerase subunit sigma-70 [Nocardia sp. NPDC127526]|uniref:RNA polymerase subunit sigma-70 n=1 Tax=Nocardia sp. NPDC127526 TaxID=3345393 RepID=UPI0036400706